MTFEIANRLYELRKKHNLSQEELAEKLGVSRQAVSKWERCEASPDTDNLIALAKIYDLTLDELIYGEKEEKNENKSERANGESSSEQGYSFVDVDNGKDKVKIGPTGIFVESEDGEKVKIGWSGIKIESTCTDDDDEHDDDDDEINDDDKRVYVTGDGKVKIVLENQLPKLKKPKFWLQIPYPIICTILYLWFGFENICGGWGHAWIIFVTIPVYYSFIEAIYNRKVNYFAYPVFISFLYLYFGLYCNNWHPSWLVFLTIPVFYPIASIIDSGIKRIK